ncbi:MAG TPA: hypothetical protein VMB03_04940 [Bryobacteraceae bacterium]|nr:hypothetical protein [Bryobacteraceae bacterium]
MRHPIVIAAILAGIAPMAQTQSGAKVTIPPHSQQSAEFPFANICPTAETFKVSAEPAADWLRFEPSTIDVQPGTSFVVRLTANSGNHAAGTYRSGLRIICASCAASNPPCFESVTDLPVQLTVANVSFPGSFEPLAGAANPGAVTQHSAISQPAPYIPPEAPRTSRNVWFAVVAGGLLLIGAVVLILAVYALRSDRKFRPATGELSAESERHQVRR